MNKFLLLILLTFASGLYALEGKGFAGVAFGATQEQVIEEMIKMGYALDSRPGLVVIPVYKLGDLLVEVNFYFNRAEQFYSYEMRTGAVESTRFSKVMEAVEYMSKQFVSYFNQPSFKNQLQMSDVTGKKAAPFWIWSDKDLDVSTFIRNRDVRYFAQGTVTHKNLALAR